MSEQNALLHWYSFSYEGLCEDTGREANGTAYTGYPSKGVTLPMIRENVGNAGLMKGAALIAVSYLGEMTHEQFSGQAQEH